MLGSDHAGNGWRSASCSESPRLGRLRGFFDRRADPAILSVVDEAVRALDCQGADIVELDDPVDFEQILNDHRTVMAAEAADVHSDWLDEFPDDYPPRIRELILEGRSLTALEYLHAERSDATHTGATAGRFQQS